MGEEYRCSGRVWHSRAFRDSACSRKGTIFEDDKWWCKTHAPSFVAKRKENEKVKFAKEHEARKRKHRIEELKEGVVRNALDCFAPYKEGGDDFPTRLATLRAYVAALQTELEKENE